MNAGKVATEGAGASLRGREPGFNRPADRQAPNRFVIVLLPIPFNLVLMGDFEWHLFLFLPIAQSTLQLPCQRP